MMAAFIVAVRGTVGQAVLLGLSATVSHTAIVWLVAVVGLHYGGQWNAETTEPYFQIASAALIIAVALWMLWRTWRQERQRHVADHEHSHDHGHGDESRSIDTGHGVVRLEIFEQGMPPHFRLHQPANHWAAAAVSVVTERPDGRQQTFAFEASEGLLQSVQEIPEPHEFVARLKFGHAGHSHDYDVEFTEKGHAHVHPEDEGLDIAAPGYQDAHERAHANDIRRRFASRNVTTGQIIAFGLTGGLVPCPAAITVLLLCLQLKKVTLGATLVLCFSIGLALTMVLSGTIAALGVKHAASRWSGFGEIARKAPYVSSVIIILVGLYVGYLGWSALP